MTGVPSGRGRSIFISYDHADKKFADRLFESLSNAGVEVWMDKTGIPGGVNYVREIPAAIDKHKEFLVILTPASVTSRWVEVEILRAFTKGKGILSLMHTLCDPPFLIAHIQCINRALYSYDDLVTEILLRKGQVPPWYRRVMAYITVNRVAAMFAILVASTLYAGYRLMPSNTSAILLDNHNTKALTVQLQNHGGQSSMIKGGYRLRFGDLPIVDATLDVAQKPLPGVVPGHDIVPVTLDKKSGFGPKKLPDGAYLKADEIEKRLTGNITLEVDVKESSDPPDGPFHTVRITFPASQISTFLTERLPTVVPGGNHAP